MLSRDDFMKLKLRSRGEQKVVLASLEVPAYMCILLNVSFQVCLQNGSNSHTVCKLLDFFVLTYILATNSEFNVVEKPVYVHWMLDKFIFWSLARADYMHACAWQAPISETWIALLKDTFDRLILGIKCMMLQKIVRKLSILQNGPY